MSWSRSNLYSACVWLLLAVPHSLAQGLHTAPIIVNGSSISPILRYPLASYRVFQSSPNGKASIIPFQIDEINDAGDFVLDQGSNVTSETGNRIFDAQDQLSFMGDDVGPVVEPTIWPDRKPNIVFELRVRHPIKNPMGPQMGAVYVGIYFGGAPELSKKKYVVFNRSQALIQTSRYRYKFDQKNWLVAEEVAVSVNNKEPYKYEKILDSTTFYLKGDLKYFITVEANHRSVESELEAWKTGPIRSIIRVSFHYTLLKLKLELGMFTEISFFSNSVSLPAIMYSPLDGQKSLNPGSGIYYGLSLHDNPNEYAIESNMAPILAYSATPGSDILKSGKDFLGNLLGTKKEATPSTGLYWISLQGKNRTIYFEVTPSPELQLTGLSPSFYRENQSGAEISNRNNNDPAPFGKSPVNIGIWFDGTKIGDGEHAIGFRLFFENVLAPERLDVFKGLNDWLYEVRRI